MVVLIAYTSHHVSYDGRESKIDCCVCWRLHSKHLCNVGRMIGVDPGLEEALSGKPLEASVSAVVGRPGANDA